MRQDVRNRRHVDLAVCRNRHPDREIEGIHLAVVVREVARLREELLGVAFVRDVRGDLAEDRVVQGELGPLGVEERSANSLTRPLSSRNSSITDLESSSQRLCARGGKLESSSQSTTGVWRLLDCY